MEGNLDDVVALADRLARRSESRLTGDEAGHCQDGPDGPDGEEEEEVEQLRMASPFCNGREDSYFSPQDVEIEKDLEDNKAALVKSLRAPDNSAASIVSRPDAAAATEEAPRIELSTTDLKEHNKEHNKENNNNNNNVAHAQRLRLRLEDVEGLSSPATLSRLFQKRSHKSATDVVVSVGGNEDKRCDSNSGSPGSKSVKSLSSMSSTTSGSTRSWLSSLSLSGRKRHKSGAARKLFEPTTPKEAKKKEEESFEWDSCQRIHPRANSAGQLVRSPSPDSDDDDDDVHGEVHLTRLATSDLRNLELRYFDKWRGTSDYSPAMDAVATALAAVTSTPTAVAAGGVGGASVAASAASAAAAAASRRRRSLSTEDVSGLELTDCHHHADTSATTAGDTSRGSSKRASVSPHPQAYFTIDSRRLASMHKRSARNSKLLYGVKQFNLDPKKGLSVLQESGFLPSPAAVEKMQEASCFAEAAVSSSSAMEAAAKAVAQFLFEEGRLSKNQIGNFIGGVGDFNKRVLREFVSCHQFTHLNPLSALRQFLWSFRLPGEAQQIDRIMEAFAQRYCEQNPRLFEERDTCYILCFSIIMLNTMLHNPNVKIRPTLDGFVSQNRGINSGKDLPRPMLEQIYWSIKEEPFKIPDETYDDLMYTFFSPEKEGWLLKEGGGWKNWKRRWFVLNNRCLYYFQHTSENSPKGIIPLENVKVRSIDDVGGKTFCFEVYNEKNEIVKATKTDSRGTAVVGNHTRYRMSASSAQERDAWLQCINESIREHPFHDIVAAKKASLQRRSHRNRSTAGPSGFSTPKSTPKTPRASAAAAPRTPRTPHTPAA